MNKGYPGEAIRRSSTFRAGNPARRATFPLQSSDMTLKKVALYAVVIFLVAFVVRSPVAAAKVVRVTGEASGQWLSTAFDALTKFIRSLT
jgi:hypothetical protein